MFVKALCAADVLERYAHDWLTTEDEPKVGWENAPHHARYKNFPHHKHIGDQGN
ncbi:MAG: DUF6516 family protein [Chloroflexota bacterium]